MQIWLKTADMAIRNLDETMQNEQASESTIRDADMAKEMTQMTIRNMLMQSGTAMPAQANSLPNSILSLLQ